MTYKLYNIYSHWTNSSVFPLSSSVPEIALRFAQTIGCIHILEIENIRISDGGQCRGQYNLTGVTLFLKPISKQENLQMVNLIIGNLSY